MVYKYFFAGELNAVELGWFLSRGWRKFGHYFFQPSCPQCQACAPLRVPVQDFHLSRSQKRVLKKCSNIRMTIGPLRYQEELFDLYQRHSRHRFAEEVCFTDFVTNFHTPSSPALLARYWSHDQLVAAGYVDQTLCGLSSVYFIYDPEFSGLSLGIFGALQEIAHTQKLGLPYYYLGYWTPGCQRMAYKTGFHPHELYAWDSQSWKRTDAHCSYPPG